MQQIPANTLLAGIGTLAENPAITAVVTDSRAAVQNSLFVCIAGERVDGHAFAQTALAQGAAGVVAQHIIEGVPAEKTVLVHDPLADSAECEHEYGMTLTDWDALPQASAIVAAVSHKEYTQMGIDGLLRKLTPGGVFADVKSAYDPAVLQAAGARPWRL